MVSIDELEVPNVVITILRKNGVEYIEQILDSPLYNMYWFRGMGQLRSSELAAGLITYLLKNGKEDLFLSKDKVIG